MNKRFTVVLTSLAAGAALLLGGAGAALAEEYPVEPLTCTAAPASITVGGTSDITCTGFAPNSTVEFTSTGGTLSSIVFLAAAGTSETADDEGSATTTFTGTAAGEYTVTATGVDAQEQAAEGSATVTVTAADDGLSATGGTVPTAALWIGIAAIGAGAIIVTAAVVRRRNAQR